MTNVPDPAVLAKLYGPSPTAIGIALQALYARREYLSVLIALIEVEMTISGHRTVEVSAQTIENSSQSTGEA